ncbi:MAG: DNA-3-methyladenine glycosylase [Terracidiphilus sp.]
MEEIAQIAQIERGFTPGNGCEAESTETAWAEPLPGEGVRRAFLEAPPDRVAPWLLGKLLLYRSPRGLLTGRIVEVEAYLGPHHEPPDPAAHAYRGPTQRNRVLFGPAGHAYIYAIYGRHFCLNISCEAEGRAGCVLLRAIEPLRGVEQMARNRGLKPGSALRLLTSGPGRLCQALGLTRSAHNGLDLLDPASPLELRDDRHPPIHPQVTPRIGVHKAADWPLRFAVAGNPCVSGPKSLR